MRGYMRVSPTPPPTLIGADLIQEARRIERDKTIVEIQRRMNELPVEDKSRTYDKWDVSAKDFKAQMNAVLADVMRGSDV